MHFNTSHNGFYSTKDKFILHVISQLLSANPYQPIINKLEMHYKYGNKRKQTLPFPKRQNFRLAQIESICRQQFKFCQNDYFSL